MWVNNPNTRFVASRETPHDPPKMDALAEEMLPNSHFSVHRATLIQTPFVRTDLSIDEVSLSTFNS
jgi:hypothetical protein